MEQYEYMFLDPGLPKPAYNPYNFVVDLQLAGGDWILLSSIDTGLNWNIMNDDQNRIRVWKTTEVPSLPCFRLRVWYYP